MRQEPQRRVECSDCYRRYDWAVKLRRRYGLTVAEWAWFWHRQGGRCAICEHEMDKPCVDHDHDTGNVRGLLCHHCNRGIGHFRDCPAALASAIRYLEAA